MTDGTPIGRVVAAARQLAVDNRHGFVGAEHLLAALLGDGDGFAATVLSRAGLDVGQIRVRVLDGLRHTPEGAPPAEPAVSRMAERAIESAGATARRDGRPEAEERDLLRELVAQPKGRMAQLLTGDGKAGIAIRAALGIATPEPTADSAPPAPKPPKQPPKEPRPDRRTQAKSEPKADPKPKPKGEGRAERGERPERPERAKPPVRATESTPERDELPPLRIARPIPPRPFPWSMLLLLAVPASIVADRIHAAPVLVFALACLGVVPLAGLMGDATESLAERQGPTLGGLLNATFGNAAELIIAIFALRAGLVDLVKASITGSILGNLLLILGLSFIAGGTKAPIVKFNRTNAGMSAAMLALAVIGLVFPAIFHAAHPSVAAELRLSEAVSVVLVVTYGLSLLFSLKTHKALFGGGDHPAVEPKWGTALSVGILLAATLGIMFESELLVHSIGAVTADFGLSQTFLGLVLIPLIGNAAEHATAVVVARKGQTDLALQIALGSSTQVALLIAPLLVLAGLILGGPMNLVFPLFDVAALAVSTVVIAIITLDGETHWFEGVQLLAVYAMMAAAAYFI